MSENGFSDKCSREHTDDPEWIVQTKNMLRFSPGVVVWADNHKLMEFAAYLRAKGWTVPLDLVSCIEGAVRTLFDSLKFPFTDIRLHAWKAGFEYSPVLYFSCSAAWCFATGLGWPCSSVFTSTMSYKLRELTQCDEAHVTQHVPPDIAYPQQKIDFNVRLWWD